MEVLALLYVYFHRSHLKCGHTDLYIVMATNDLKNCMFVDIATDHDGYYCNKGFPQTV